MDEVRVKLKRGGVAGPFKARIGAATRVVIVRPRFETVILDALDAPVAGVVGRVAFANGHVEERTTDADGKVSFAHFWPEEKVDVSLPELDGGLWELEQPREDAP